MKTHILEIHLVEGADIIDFNTYVPEDFDAGCDPIDVSVSHCQNKISKRFNFH